MTTGPMTTGPVEAAWIDTALASIEAAFHSAEGMAYLGEDVTMIQHQLQAAALAVDSTAADELVVAALLHDIGHMVGGDDATSASDALDADRDAHHDAEGARWLSRWFGPDVVEPVRLHVAAKRFLVATEPEYAAKLSDASTHTLRLQGGPMSDVEVAEFEALTFARAAIALRRFDEAAKDPSTEAPGFGAHREILMRVLHRDATRRSLA